MRKFCFIQPALYLQPFPTPSCASFYIGHSISRSRRNKRQELKLSVNERLKIWQFKDTAEEKVCHCQCCYWIRNNCLKMFYYEFFKINTNKKKRLGDIVTPEQHRWFSTFDAFDPRASNLNMLESTVGYRTFYMSAILMKFVQAAFKFTIWCWDLKSSHASCGRPL